jgi:predicted RNA-binding protein YlxR (DUF448 family)
VVARDGRAVVDTAARLPGRGAWVHPASGCIDSAVKRRAFGRALKTTELQTSNLNEWAEKTMDN